MGDMLPDTSSRSVYPYERRTMNMRILNIVTSPRKEKSASAAIANAFLSEYREHARDVTLIRWIFGKNNFPSSTRKRSAPNTRVSPANR
jgi:FMN-dependent NADH-azoreductase